MNNSDLANGSSNIISREWIRALLHSRKAVPRYQVWDAAHLRIGRVGGLLMGKLFLGWQH